MEKRGFTLIELLAVIIILAIIALIATPIILNVIEDARKSAGKSEASMILSGVNNYCATSAMKAQLDESTDICNDDDGVTIDDVSQMVSLGNAKVLEVKYENGKVTKLKVKSNNYEFELQPDGSFTINGEVTDPVDPTPEEPETNLISTLLEQVETKGLVQDETNSNIYYYKGGNDVVTNNYLWYGGHQWRVIEIDTTNNTLLLISQQPLTTIYPEGSSQGKYEASYINNWLNEYFYNSLDTSIQNNIVENTFDVGIYNDVDEIIITKQNVGLLDEEQYTRAGGADSYLDIKDYFWLASLRGSFIHSSVGNDGNLVSSSINHIGGVRPVIKISDIRITGGNGTLNLSYKTADKATNTSNVQVGEYINVLTTGNECGDDNLCTFRVVSKDSDSIKVALNGLLSSSSKYGNDVKIYTSHTIYTPLNAFAEGISDTYRYTGNKTLYIGDYNMDGEHYEDVQDETLQANVGLPTIGEMFSGNDIDLGTSSIKTFVDVKTIENPTTSSSYWTMNRYITFFVHNATSDGDLSYSRPESAFGVRPVMFLKNNLIFTGGDGTAQNPYTLN